MPEQQVSEITTDQFAKEFKQQLRNSDSKFDAQRDLAREFLKAQRAKGAKGTSKDLVEYIQKSHPDAYSQITARRKFKDLNPPEPGPP